jgi:putative hydrolase of the HAD superfamily
MTSRQEQLIGIIRAESRPLEPLPSGASAVLPRLHDIKAVLFDVYGTLFVSASGQLGSADKQAMRHALRDTFAEHRIEVHGDISEAVSEFEAALAATHAERRSEDVEYPEVDINMVWEDTVEALHDRGLITTLVDDIDIPALALGFEVRSNPVWPMPGARDCLMELAERHKVVGVVSNGQWFSPLLFAALFGGTLETLGVPRDLQFWSFEAEQAKPGLTLFLRARTALEQRGIAPEQVLVVGNDMLSDIMPAAAVGFHTALFAGDARSLRQREDDPRVAGVEPDLVVLNLLDVLRCVRHDSHEPV